MHTSSLERQEFTKKALTTTLIFSLLFSLLSIMSSVVVQGESRNFNYSIKLTATYVNPTGGTSTWNLTEDDRTIGLFMSNAWQSVELKDTTFLVEELRNDTEGNSIALLDFRKQQLLPGESLSYTAEYRVISKPRTMANITEEGSGTLEAIPQVLKQNYTHAEGPWLVNDPTLVELAHNIAGTETNVLRIIKLLIGWMKENIGYTTHEFPLYPNETLNARGGDCDDQAILLITLARIMGIPSHLQIGTIYLPENVLVNETYWDNHVRAIQRKIGWHGWAMVYVPPWGWLPVDLTFVTSGFSDPLNAIRYAAVVGQNTLQYMNISKTDYVSASRQQRTFLLANGFLVQIDDEMTEVTQSGVPGGFNWGVAVAVVVVIVAFFFSSFLISRRWRKRLQEAEAPTPTPPPSR